MNHEDSFIADVGRRINDTADEREYREIRAALGLDHMPDGELMARFASAEVNVERLLLILLNGSIQQERVIGELTKAVETQRGAIDTLSDGMLRIRAQLIEEGGAELQSLKASAEDHVAKLKDLVAGVGDSAA